MGILQNAIKLSKNQKKMILAMLVVFALTSTHVQAAEPSEVLPDAPMWQTGGPVFDDMPERALVVPDGISDDKPSVEQKVRVMQTSATAYTSSVEECDDTPFITADGSHVRDGIIAANFLKFGTKVRIPDLYGDKIFEVHDRMNKRFPNRIDVWMTTKSEARQFGVKRNIKIEVLI
ncbi:MAG: hypothetical protein WC641_06715 [Patescibacteria group bacterium]